MWYLFPLLRYVSVYPIALSVRSSNVYEERSLGLAEDSLDDSEDEPRTKVWGSYLAWHARRQLAFGAYIVRLAHLLTVLRTRYRYVVDCSRSCFDLYCRGIALKAFKSPSLYSYFCSSERSN